jgi:hypothetical protein
LHVFAIIHHPSSFPPPPCRADLSGEALAKTEASAKADAPCPRPPVLLPIIGSVKSMVKTLVSCPFVQFVYQSRIKLNQTESR